MDSRIREIEQWVAEAREGLCDGGREAYIRKLYLLEAEIRAVLKADGVLPELVSPQASEERVRRFHPTALAFSGAAALLGLSVLAAATFYFANGVLSPNQQDQSTAQAMLATSRGVLVPASDPPTRMNLDAYLASQGEVRLPESWAPETEPRLLGNEPRPLGNSTPKSAATTPSGSTTVLILATSKPVGAKPAVSTPARQVDKPRAAHADGSEATDVVFVAGVPAPNNAPAKRAAGKEAASRGAASGWGGSGLLAREVFFPEGIAPPVKPIRSVTKTKMGDLEQDQARSGADKGQAELTISGEDEAEAEEGAKQAEDSVRESGAY